MTAPASERDPKRARRVTAALVLAAASLALDLGTKAWVWDKLRGQPAETVIDGVLYLEFSFNTGSAFGLFGGQDFARPFFIVVTLVTVAYMALLLRKLPTDRLYGHLAIGLVIGGALGNLHDRLIRALEIGGELRHGVVDWILVYYLPGRPWPNFNIADAALVAGVGLLLPYLLLHAEPRPAPKAES
ncbi:MAG: signal peptidase II [Myxococcales bacterium]|nr:signal peptidase II [Myxococcales bacterium]MCB9701586.1 signal peptidase II [Myxococcales bacterium]